MFITDVSERSTIYKTFGGWKMGSEGDLSEISSQHTGGLQLLLQGIKCPPLASVGTHTCTYI